MRRLLFVAVLACLMSVVGVLSPAGEARAECPRQGAFALALAQLLNYSVSSSESAVMALTSIGVSPLHGWSVAECLDGDTVVQVDQALKKAAAAGLVRADLASGAVAAALAAIGANDLIAALDRAMPIPPFGGGPAVGGGLGNQRYPAAAPPPPPPPVSPFVPR